MRSLELRIAASAIVLATVVLAGPTFAQRGPPRGAAPAVPLPPPRPAMLAPGGQTAQPSGTQDASAAACRDRLAALGAALERLPPITDGRCPVADLFRVTKLPGGIVLAPDAKVVCPVAEALERWTREAVLPEAVKEFGSAPTAILIGTSYECRGRNRGTETKLSEHGLANAVDIMGFAFGRGPPVTVASAAAEPRAARFLGAIRARACSYFTTVLGPGSDSFHADHHHLDLRRRKAGASLCQ